MLAAGLLVSPWSLALSGGDDDDEVEASLSPPPGAPLPGASGEVSLERDDDEQEFSVEAEGLDASGPATPFEAWLEDGVGTGDFFSVGTLVFGSGESGGQEHWELELESEGGPPPVLGVADLADLAGRLAQVRGADDVTVYLEGTIPSIGSGQGGGSGPSQHGNASLQRPDPAPDADAVGRVRIKTHGGRQEFRVEARNLPTDPGVFSVMVETGVGAGSYFLVGVMALADPGKGRFELEFEADGGAPAALGVADLSELEGRRVQVTDPTLTVFLRGVLPGVSGAQGGANFNVKTNLSHPPGPSVVPGAGGWMRCRFNAPQGSPLFEIRTRRLPSGEFSIWVADGPGSGNLVEVGVLADGKFKRDTKRGQSLPLGAGSLAELAGRHLEIREGSGAIVGQAVLDGDIP